MAHPPPREASVSPVVRATPGTQQPTVSPLARNHLVPHPISQDRASLGREGTQCLELPWKSTAAGVCPGVPPVACLDTQMSGKWAQRLRLQSAVLPSVLESHQNSDHSLLYKPTLCLLSRDDQSSTPVSVRGTAWARMARIKHLLCKDMSLNSQKS